MYSALLLFVTVLALTAFVQATQELNKQDKHDNHDGHLQLKEHFICQEANGGTFNESQIFGTWRLLYLKTRETMQNDDDKIAAEAFKCTEFSPVSDQERKNMPETMRKNMERAVLKMQLPCREVNIGRFREIDLLEKLKDGGYYRDVGTIPPPKGSPPANRFTWRFKFVEGQYLAMVGCVAETVVLMGKQKPQDPQTETKLKKLKEYYWQGYGAQ